MIPNDSYNHNSNYIQKAVKVFSMSKMINEATDIQQTLCKSHNNQDKNKTIC